MQEDNIQNTQLHYHQNFQPEYKERWNEELRSGREAGSEMTGKTVVERSRVEANSVLRANLCVSSPCTAALDIRA